MSTSLRDAILAAVPADGSTIGNLKLFRAIQGSVNATGEPVTQEAVQAIREELVSDGILGRGRGRGGLVFRCGAEASLTSAVAPVDSVPELAASAEAKADVDADGKPEPTPMPTLKLEPLLMRLRSRIRRAPALNPQITAPSAPTGIRSWPSSAPMSASRINSASTAHPSTIVTTRVWRRSCAGMRTPSATLPTGC